MAVTELKSPVSTPSGLQKLLDDLPRTGPGTRAGEMLRRYWHPVCLSENLRTYSHRRPEYCAKI